MELDKNSIKQILQENEKIYAAYIYGSYATGRQHKESDIDIGVLVNEELDREELSEVKAALQNEVDREVDIRVLNERDTRFLQNVLSQAELVFSRDEEERVSFEVEVMQNYRDMKPFYEEYDRFTEERLTS